MQGGREESLGKDVWTTGSAISERRDCASVRPRYVEAYIIIISTPHKDGTTVKGRRVSRKTKN